MENEHEISQIKPVNEFIIVVASPQTEGADWHMNIAEEKIKTTLDKLPAEVLKRTTMPGVAGVSAYLNDKCVMSWEPKTKLLIGGGEAFIH